jgi:poly(A) polymerase
MALDPDIQSWLTEPDVSQIFAALPKDSTRFVGGCVRNAILGEPIGDIDLATQLKPDALVTALNGAKIKTVPTGIAHGTVTAVINGTPYEITSLRQDVETDGRRAVVSFTQDWAEDAQRRDLTINALYADQTGQVFDPTGTGLDDIAARKFRFVGNADARVREDYLRILRFFRFVAWYGNDAKIDAQALTACRENRAGLKSLSAERVWSELKKLLSARDPSRALRIMLTNEILETVLPDASNCEGAGLLVTLEADEGIAPDPLLRLMAMAARDEFAFAGLCKRLKVSKAEKARLLGWAGDRTLISPGLEGRERKIAAYHSGAQVLYDRAVLRAAGVDDPIIAGKWMSLAHFSQQWERPVFPLKGRDLKTMGVKDGPQMGKMLDALKALWIRSGFEADKDKLLVALQMINR